MKKWSNGTKNGPGDMAIEIQNYLDGLETKYPNMKIKIVSDNPCFDLGKVDWLLDHYTDRLGVRYSFNGAYRSVEDPTEQLKPIPESWIVPYKLPPHTHDPVDDARHIGYLWFQARDTAEKLSGHVLVSKKHLLSFVRQMVDKRNNDPGIHVLELINHVLDSSGIEADDVDRSFVTELDAILTND